MDSRDPDSTTAPAAHDADGDAATTQATGDDTPSAAELAFIERVRRDRERARALRRRLLVAGALGVAAIGVLSFTGALPRLPSGTDTPPAVTSPMTADATLVAETIEQRLARLEARVNALEDRAAAGEPRAPGVPATTTTARATADAATVVAPPAAVSAAAPPRATRPSPAPVSRAPTPAPPPSRQPRQIKAPSAESPKRVTVVPAPRPTIRPAAAREATFGESVRRGWESVGRQVRRTPQDVRDGFDKVRQLFVD